MRFGCIGSNLSPDSVPSLLIEKVNIIFDTLFELEMNNHWWKLYETKAYKILKDADRTFLE